MSSLEILKGWDVGQIAAVFHKIAGDDPKKLKALLRDEYEVSLIERVLKLADKTGRIIPRDLKAAVCDPNKDFYLAPPSLKTLDDYASRLVRFHEAFKPGPIISVAEFEGGSKKLISKIKNNKSLANLLDGVYLPIIIPKLDNFVDYGKTLEKVFVPAVKLSYEKEFPGRKFYNYRENDFVGKVSIIPGSRHGLLVDAIKRGIVVAIYFPNPLQGFSTPASREQMAILPKSLILSGGVDAFSAITMYPDVLARDWHTPGYDLSALSWQSPDCSLSLKASDDRLNFVNGGNLGFVDGDYSSGLLFLGEC